jgi:hypothetical protein
VSADHSVWLPWYQLIDVHLGQSISINKHEFQIKLGAINVLNTNYQTVFNRPMPLRFYNLTINYTFG